MNSFDLLSPEIRKYIRDKRWDQLRPIQAAAIERIMQTDLHYILAAATASGKTEAAFLPLLSKLDFNDESVQILYIAPLIALINDQFERIESLCASLSITVTKWHGEANLSDKNALVKHPNGIVLITPESLEAMFVNKPQYIKKLFRGTKYVVIDEIHSFIGSDRGVQLKSLLSRIKFKTGNDFRMIGLSATLPDYAEAKRFTGDEQNTRVLLDRQSKEIEISFRYFENAREEVSLDLMKDIYLETIDQNVLLFPNSRGKAEEVALKLKKISDRANGHPNYFAHHSSVHKDERLFIENFAKASTRMNFCISCTSTLELGIDIGRVDKVIQLDATNSIASLIQRTGRSGRRDGQASNLVVYATTPWSLLQSLACWELYKEGFIEPPENTDKPYDLLLHQILSMVKSASGLPYTELIEQLQANAAFRNIPQGDVDNIIQHLVNIDFLEALHPEFLIGVEGEFIVNSRDFYSVFKTQDVFKVVNMGNIIGEMPYTPQLELDENIILAAKTWKIKLVEFKSKRIEVLPAHDGKKPVFHGTGSMLHARIREKMLEILMRKDPLPIRDEQGKTEMATMRRVFSACGLKDIETDRPMLITQNALMLYTFSGTRINRTIQFLLQAVGVKAELNELSTTLSFSMTEGEFKKMWRRLPMQLEDLDAAIYKVLAQNPSLLSFSKWAAYLPLRYQAEFCKEHYFDFDNAIDFILRIKPKAARAPAVMEY